jgi:hypothetical protein
MRAAAPEAWFHPVDPGDGHVEQDVHQVVGQEIDLVDVEHAAVGRGQQAGREPDLTTGRAAARSMEPTRRSLWSR